MVKTNKYQVDLPAVTDNILLPHGLNGCLSAVLQIGFLSVRLNLSGSFTFTFWCISLFDDYVIPAQLHLNCLRNTWTEVDIFNNYSNNILHPLNTLNINIRKTF